MANKQMTMKNFNGTSWDTLYPKTVAEQVIESSSKSFVTSADKAKWDAKANANHTHTISEVSDLETALNGKANASHVHAISNVTGLQTALDGKADSSHNHTIANVTGLQTALNAKSDEGHKHSISDITGLGNVASKNTGTTAGTIPVIESNGKLDSSILPAIAVTDTFVVASQTEMLALTAEVGDLAVRSDLKKTFILKATGASTLANWQELLSPTDAVTSVAGKTGAVTLTKNDVGLGNVSNESKAMMFSSPSFTGTPTAPTASTSDNSTKVATTEFVQNAVQAVSSSMPKITVSGTQPANAVVGDFWYELV